jgi:uncharacterized protein (TIRG00374 family)
MVALLLYADPRAVGHVLSGTRWTWIVLAVGTVIVDRMANAYRWLLLLRATEHGRHVPLGTAMHVFFVSGFLGSFLPGSVGGDAVRALSLSRLHVAPSDAFASVVVDRMLGVASVLVMAAGGLVLVGNLFSWAAITAMTLPVLLGVAGIGVLIFDRRFVPGLATTWLERRLPGLHRVVAKALRAIAQYGDARRTLVTVFVLSIGVQILRTFEAWMLGQALGIEAALQWYFAVLPIVILVMLLPTSVAGLGTGALAFQVLFAPVGVDAADSFALALLFSALGIVGALAGGVLFMTGREAPPVRRDGYHAGND